MERLVLILLSSIFNIHESARVDVSVPFSSDKKCCKSIRLMCHLNFKIPEIYWRRSRYTVYGIRITHLFHSIFNVYRPDEPRCSLFTIRYMWMVSNIIHRRRFVIYYDLKRDSLDKNLYRMHSVRNVQCAQMGFNEPAYLQCALSIKFCEFHDE